MAANIIIFTAPVQAGKTTALMRWAAKKDRLSGFLAPDADGLRRLFFLNTRQWADFQLTPAEASAADTGEVVAVGKFYFRAAAFAAARRVLAESLEQRPDWLVIDEVGKLELKGEGLEPAVGQVIRYFKNPKTTGGLLLVVREELVAQAIAHYALENYRVIRLGEELPEGP
ncbi:MAG: hypothetical protein H6564_00415 [Lewinellaceae bacterium]|nr:hypothetical protein [Lewinellaceae bacterium]